MFTRAEKGYLALTLGLLAAGSGLKAWRLSGVRIGPFQDPSFAAVPPDTSSVSATPDKSILSVAESGARSSSDSRGFSPVDSQSAVSHAPDSASAVNDPSNPARKEPSDPTLFGASEGAPVAAHNFPTASKQGQPRPRPTVKSGFTGKVDLNRAPATELTKVKGIGEKTALAIVEYRAAHGPFRDLRDLLQVKGIGEKKLEKLGPYLIL
jgi:competence protein ComEA